MAGDASRPRNGKTPFPLSQETLAVLAVGATLLATMLVTTGRLEDRIDQYRVEAREGREALRAEGREDREALRAEARDDRMALARQIEALRAEARKDRRAFARQIAVITREQAHLNGLVEGLRDDEDRPKSTTGSSRDG